MTGTNCDIRRGSHYWLRCDALALEMAGIEAGLELETQQIIPTTADTVFLNRHGIVEGVAREPATAAELVFSVLGTPGITAAIGSAVFIGTNGLTYAPTSSTVPLDSVTGIGSVSAESLTPGALGNLAVTAIVQWSAAPAGLNPTATVASITVAGAEAETDAAYAARIVARRQERPASFNRADVRAIAEEVTGVAEAYVYPLLEPVSNDIGVPGTFQIVALGPVSTDANGVQNGDAGTNLRFRGPPGSEQTDIEGYFEGTLDKDGVTVPLASQSQRRPVTVPQGNYKVLTAGQLAQSVTIAVTVTTANIKQWSGTMTTAAGSTTTTIMVTGNQTSLGLVGKPLLVKLATGTYRGLYAMRTPLDNGLYIPATNTTVFAVSAMVSAPVVGATVYPACANFEQIRLALFALFDRLTPGNSSGVSARWPNADVAGPSVLYIGELIAAVCAVPGVVTAAVTLPVADVSPAVLNLVDLNVLIVTSN